MKNTKKKVLFVATVDSHIELFHLPYLKMFKDKGYEVHVATNTDKKIEFCDKKHKISIARSPFKLCNLKAIKQLKKIVDEEHFDIIHCHTPMGGVVARLAAKKARKNGTRMIYTAHGFHFYKGAPLKNWLLFYPVEKFLAKYTDTLITINTEDFERAKKKFGKRCFDIQYVPGVGVDEKKFKKKLTKEEKHNLRKSLGLKDDDFVMIFPAELSKRKNQMWLIKTLKPVFDEDKKKHLLLPGKDSLNGKCQKLIEKLRLGKQIHVLGFRKDIDDLMNISDCAISASKQEGLPVNVIEASYANLPIIATCCRGNRDVVENSKGFLVSQGNGREFRSKIAETENDVNLSTKKQALKNKKIFMLQNVKKQYSDIYGINVDESEKISVIIPIHNSEKYLKKCLESVCGQTYNNLEIITIVDNSSDKSLDICRNFAKKDSRIIIKCVNYGNVSESRNYGIDMSTGKYIGFVDSDDYIDKDCYRTLLLDLKKTGSKIATCGFAFENESGKEIKSFSHRDEIFSRKYYPEKIYTNRAMQGYVWNKLYDNTLFRDKAVRFNPSVSIMEDDLLNFMVFEKNKSFKICFRGEKLYHHVQYKNGLSSVLDLEKHLSMFRVRAQEIEILEKDGGEATALKAKYIINFKRDALLIKQKRLKQKAEYQLYLKKAEGYKKEVHTSFLKPTSRVQYNIALHFPFIFKLWLVKNHKKELV